MITKFKEIYGYFFVLIFTVFILMILLKGSDLRIPFTYGGDSILNSLWVKSIIYNGWYLHNDYVGAPKGLDMNDFAMADTFHLLIIKIITSFTSNYALALNLYYLLTYPLVACTSFYSFRQFKISLPFAITASIIFAFLPYHYLRGESHLFLASYYMIPLIVVMIFWIWRQELTKKKIIMSIIISAVVSSTGIYYAYFSCIFLAFVASYVFLTSRKKRVLLIPVILIGVIMIGGILNLSPTLIYQFNNGKNLAVAKRSPAEAEIYALKITHLLMPAESHRFSKFKTIAQKYNEQAPLSNENKFASLGIIGSMGFIILLLSLFSRWKDENIQKLGYLNLVALLLASIGGFGAIIASFFSEIRGYNRISVFIAYFSILTIFLLIDKIKKLSFPMKSVFSLILLFFCILDQTNNAFSMQTDAIRQAFVKDKSYFQRIEESIPNESMIFQLPYIPFPEHPPVVNMTDYDHLRAYLQTKNLRWSYGAMKGRVADDWIKNEANKPLKEMVNDIVIAGFKGIYINRNGYQDRAQKLESELQLLTKSLPLENQDNSLAFYNLTDYLESIKSNYPDFENKKEAITNPVSIIWGNGFYAQEGDASKSWRWSDKNSELTLNNPSSKDKKVTLETIFYTSNSSIITLDGFLKETIQVDDSGKLYKTIITLPPGKNTIVIKSNAEQVRGTRDPRNLYFRIEDFKIYE
ncbi:hypothetical protein GCM10008018_16110 [Paenibacillus marchantiophytorum]|uniref:Uncharacterized protein n=1 Tax=Paenibacillus marchantiophytorum TaxID=1619310 RepID=A0ABQ2BUM6_9BACL|nr:hypothetical protein [Paenibacillus marchantiophytorum]GGI46236.1 hypothetical protein GCM10008018_16110 [Paenibacillus marchantiophytorum]